MHIRFVNIISHVIGFTIYIYFQYCDYMKLESELMHDHTNQHMNMGNKDKKVKGKKK